MASPVATGFVKGGEDFNNLGKLRGDTFDGVLPQDLDIELQRWEEMQAKNPALFKQYLDESNPYYARNKAEFDRAQKWKQYKESGDEMGMARKAQVSQAKAFEERMPLFRQQLGYDVDTDASKQLATQMLDINRGANRRGLLYSGLRANDARKAGVAAKAQANEKKVSINKDLSDISNNLNQAAADTGLKTAAQRQHEANSKMSHQQKMQIAALERRNKSNAAAGDLFSSAFAIGGEALA